MGTKISAISLERNEIHYFLKNKKKRLITQPPQNISLRKNP